MDIKMDMFRNDSTLHNEVVNHLLSKGIPRGKASLFYQHETWLILADQIEAGNYHFSPLIEGYIDKRNGKNMTYEAACKRNFVDVRKIYMMTLMDRAVAHMIYLIYYRLYIGLSDKSCVSYKSGIGTSKVTKDITYNIVTNNMTKGFKTDIKHYFDEVNIETIEYCLKLMDTGSPLDRLLYELYHDDRVLINNEETHKYRGLIQGCAFACLLANLCLADIDRECCKLNVVYYRYSDDIICLGKDYKKALSIIKKKLSQKGLQLHPDKFQMIHDANNEWFEFLGFSHRGELISLGSKTLATIQHEIKIRTMSIVRKNHKPANKNQLKKMIHNIQYYFFTAFAKSKENFGMGVYLFGTINVEKDLNTIETYIKDCLRAAYTGNTKIYGLGYVTDRKDYVIDYGKDGINVAENRKKTQTKDWDLLKELGWVSLNKMYQDYHRTKELYENDVLLMANHISTW